MKRFSTYVALVALSCLTVGCPPEKRIVWSHDGHMAAVSGDESLHFIDADGKVLLPCLKAQVTHCSWFKNDRRVAIVRVEPAKSWNEIADLLDTQQLHTIQQHAEALKQKVMAYEGDWEQFDIGFKDDYSPGTTAAILMYVRDKLSEGLQQKLAAKWDALQDMKIEVNVLQIYDVSDTTLSSGKILFRSLDEIGAVRLNHRQDRIAFASRKAATLDNKLTLFATDLAGTTIQTVATNVGADCTWSPDDRQLAYFKCMAGDSSDLSSLQLGSLTFATIADESGKLSATIEQREEIGVLFNGLWSLHWLSDGRLLFSSVEVTLPATNADMPQRWGLFIYDPRMPTTVSRVFARSLRQPLQESFPHFELSPDERRVLMLGPKGEVVIYDLTTGKAQVLANEPCTKDSGSPQTVPVWRGNDEVCYDVCTSAGNNSISQREIVLWNDGKTRTLSDGWPEEMMTNWLLKKQAAPQDDSEK